MISTDGQTLLMRTIENRGLKSHKVSPNVYDGRRSFEISSWKTCEILAKLHGWDLTHTYRIPGSLMQGRRSVRFPLAEAEVIGKESS